MSESPSKLPVSAAIITLNEEKNIEDCLRSLSWASEIVVVDSFSQDKTPEICAAYGAKFVPRKFTGHIEQKQAAVELCSYDWVFCLDADERVSEELKTSLFQLFEEDSHKFYGYEVNRKNIHLGRWIKYGGWYPDSKIRLFNKKHGRWGGYNPHDKIEIEGASGKLKGDIIHYPFETLFENVQTNNSYSSIMASELFASGVKFSGVKLLFKPVWKFMEEYFFKMGFLDRMPGLIIAVGASYSMFLKQAKIWELQMKNKEKAVRFNKTNKNNIA